MSGVQVLHVLHVMLLPESHLPTTNDLLAWKLLH